jgi:hypothetical protein
VSEKPPSLAPPLPRAIGRLGLYATYVAAALFTLAVAGDLDVLVRHAPLVGWLALLVGAGPLVALLLSTLASYTNYFGVWRVVRGKDEYDVKGDLKSHAADAPQAAQALLAGRTGCVPAASTLLLGLSLLLTGATIAPPQMPFVGALGTWSGHVGTLFVNTIPARPTVVPSPTASATPTGTPSPTATPVPAVIKFVVSPTAASATSCSIGLPPAAQQVTLDNTGSNMDVSWQATAVEKDGAGNLWAVSSPASGDIPAGGKQTITVSLNPQSPPLEVCRTSSPNGTPWHVTIATELAGSYTFTYTIYG